MMNIIIQSNTNTPIEEGLIGSNLNKNNFRIRQVMIMLHEAPSSLRSLPSLMEKISAIAIG